MKEAADILSFFASDDGTFRFFALLFPGFVAVAVYDLRVPGERRKWADMGVSLVAYSIVIDVVAAIYLKYWPVNRTDISRVALCGFVFDIVIPAAVGWLVVDLRESLANRGYILSAMPKAWDAFFSRMAGTPMAIVLTLSDGRKIGGYWAENPVASSFPADEDLLITVPVTVDQKNGNFLKRVEGAKGLLIKRDDILTLEAFDAEMMAELAAKTDLARKASVADAPTNEKESHG